MRMDDMILVSIDDHSIEPPDMYDRHLPAKYRDQAPKIVRNDEGIDQWVFQGQATSTPVRDVRHGRMAAGGVGFQPRCVLGAASRVLRRPRAGPGHERQRGAGLDVLSDHGRVQRPYLHRGR